MRTPNEFPTPANDIPTPEGDSHVSLLKIAKNLGVALLAVAGLLGLVHVAAIVVLLLLMPYGC